MRAFRVGIAGPVGSGKTALVDCLSQSLWPACTASASSPTTSTRKRTPNS